MMKIEKIFLMLLMLVPTMVRAQYSFDFLSVEALIDDHKRIRSVLMARSGVEQANELLHQYSSEANVDYDSLNVKLDKYTKCFDIIDVIYNGGVTVLNVKNTYDDVSDRITQLKDLLERFTTQLTLRGNIVSSDTIIINACDRAVNQVLVDGRELTNASMNWRSTLLVRDKLRLRACLLCWGRSMSRLTTSAIASTTPIMSSRATSPSA